MPALVCLVSLLPYDSLDSYPCVSPALYMLIGSRHLLADSHITHALRLALTGSAHYINLSLTRLLHRRISRCMRE
jgi:hypothetical protein